MSLFAVSVWRRQRKARLVEIDPYIQRHWLYTQLNVDDDGGGGYNDKFHATDR